MMQYLSAWRNRWLRLTAWEAAGLNACATQKSASALFTDCYLVLMLFAFPLVLHDGYFDITETKWLFFCTASVAYLLSLCIFFIVSPQNRGRGRRLFRPCSLPVLFLLWFSLSFLIAAFRSGNWIEGVFGAHNRYQGLLSALLYTGVCFALYRHFRVSRAALLSLLLGCSLATLLAACNHFGFDPLGVCARLGAHDRGRYVSTLGNINFFSSYLSLMLPLVLALWCSAESGFWRVASGISLFCGALSLPPSASESLLAALLVSGVSLVFFLFDSPRAMRRFLLSIVWMLVALCAEGLLSARVPTVYAPAYFLRPLMRVPVLIGVALPCLLLSRLLTRCSAETLLRLRKPYCIAIGALLFAAAVAVLLFNTVFVNVSLGTLDRAVKFGPDWGTERGRIWAYCIDVFRRSDLLTKVFGGGPGVLYALDADMRFFGDAVLDNAHNEYLHNLLTVGVFGLTAYLGALVCTLRGAFAVRQAPPLIRAFSLGIIGYAAQAFFNIAQPCSTPLLFLFLGVVAGLTRRASANSPVDGDDVA